MKTPMEKCLLQKGLCSTRRRAAADRRRRIRWWPQTSTGEWRRRKRRTAVTWLWSPLIAPWDLSPWTLLFYQLMLSVKQVEAQLQMFQLYITAQATLRSCCCDRYKYIWVAPFRTINASLHWEHLELDLLWCYCSGRCVICQPAVHIRVRHV